MFISSSINLTIPSTTQFPNRISANSFPASSRSPVLLISKKGLPCHNSSAPGYHYPRTCCQVTVNGMTGLYYCVVKHLSVRLRVAPVCICDARPLTGSRLCPGPSGWANAATGSVSGRVWAEMTSCPAHRAFLHACSLCKCVVMRRRKPRYSECDRMSCPQIFKAFPVYFTAFWFSHACSLHELRKRFAISLALYKTFVMITRSSRIWKNTEKLSIGICLSPNEYSSSVSINFTRSGNVSRVSIASAILLYCPIATSGACSCSAI